ncbi:DUF397 domain-containing protein [Actinomadura sp. KC216]|uniref:DUF397 domain-containing protein n=1 Tax=Actinomadura sp. KC216 TaxID=2530370 RepID=UPI00104E594F|nr:DUF397 domain-containing protein [Actinomadura sp. KC216]TDB87077.1 DUF397 domain-containing protein [Actinomadura sp. KC216]
MDVTSVVWRKASRTTNNGGACVELAPVSSTIAVRDSKDPDGPKLFLTRRAFTALLSDIKR